MVHAAPRPENTARELRNGTVVLAVNVGTDRLLSQRLSVEPSFAKANRTSHHAIIEADGDFGLDVMYTDWRGPRKQNNADNPVMLSKQDFTLSSSGVRDLPRGGQELILFLTGKENPLHVRLTYKLEAGAFYVRRKIAVSDSSFGHHFLRGLYPVREHLSGITGVVNRGEFGQPVAIQVNGGGGFWGLEDPAAVNTLTEDAAGYLVSCGEE